MRNKISSQIIFLSLTLVILTSLVLGGLNYYQHRTEVINSIKEEKLNQVKILASNIEAKIGELKSDVLFLSSTPPIRGILRASGNRGIDPFDKSTTKQWKERLATIFKEMMYAKKDYLQIRFIGFKNEGRELVRVERRNLKISQTEEVDLQSKSGESYFKETFKIGRGHVNLSEFSANRENGRVVFPIQMVLRASVPIYENSKTPFGMVIININYNNIFKSFKDLVDSGNEYIIADKDGKILANSDSAFGVDEETGQLKELEQYNGDLDERFKEKRRVSSFEIQNLGSTKIVTTNRIKYNVANHSEYLQIFLLTDKQKVLNQVFRETITSILVNLILVILSIIVAVYFSKSFSDPIQKLTNFATRLSNGDRGEKLNLDSNNEIGTLARTLENLSLEIDEKEAMLKKQKEAVDESAIVAETDERGVITYVNEKLLEVSKYSRDELLGRTHQVLNSGHHSKDFFRLMWNTIKSGRTWKGEVLNKAKDGTHYWVDTTIYPSKNAKGEIDRFIAIRFDITEHKKTLLMLEKASKESRIALKAKSSFFANMSHEIRTPLNGILGFTDLILEKDSIEEIKDHARYIRESGKSLLIIINDILDLSKIESGNLKIEDYEFDLKQTLEDTMSIFKIELEKKGLDSKLKISEEIPSLVVGDGMRIRQVLVNLIGNGIKFTSAGRITVSVVVEKETTAAKIVKFSVQDTGAGISLIGQKKLFMEFSQVDDSTTRKFGGTGLGLSICKKLVSLMGGDIWLESTEGEGATFFFTVKLKKANENVLPLKKEKKVLETSSTIENLDLKILVAEDNKVNQKLIMSILKREGLKNITLAENGKEAVARARENFFDVVLMDIQMPIMDGIEATKVLRSLELDYAPYIIGLSANAFDEDVKEGMSAGMNNYLAKPINVKKLYEALNEIKSNTKKAS